MKIVIADDETLVRKSLRVILRRIGVKDEDVLEVSNGKDLFEIIKQQHFDVAFVDVKMPKQNGLDAITEAKNNINNPVFFIISGYNDFDYAQRAISAQVAGYFLKPVNQETIETALEKANDILRTKNKIKKLELEKTIVKIIKNEMINETGYFLPIIVQNASIYDIEQTLADLMPNNVVPLCTNIFNNILILYCEHKAGLLNVHSTLNDVSLGNTLFFVGDICNCANFHTEIKNCENLYYASFLYNITAINTYDKLDKTLNLAISDITKKFKAVLTANDTNNIVSFSHEYSELLSAINNELKKEGLIVYFDNFKKAVSMHLGYDFSKANCYDDIIRITEEYYTEKKANKEYSIIELILEDMERNFNKDISISHYANKYNMTPNYLSSKFSSDKKISFIKHLTNLRINHAKQLLKNTSLTVSKISMMCGYYSTSHFIKIFNKRENITPVEYRNKFF